MIGQQMFKEISVNDAASVIVMSDYAYGYKTDKPEY